MKTYLSLMAENLADAGVRVLAYCLMTNHIHLVVVPSHEDSLAVLLRRVHGRYAQALNAHRSRTGHLWQNRFYSCPLSEQHLWVALRYVEQNPVRALMACAPEEYRWSSARAHLGIGPDESGLLDMTFWQQYGAAEAWRDMHQRPEPTQETYVLRRCMYSGRPFGPEEFVERLETRFGRTWRRSDVEKAMIAGQ